MYRTCHCEGASSGASAGSGEEVEVGKEEQAEGSGVSEGLGEEVAERAERAEQRSLSKIPVA